MKTKTKVITIICLTATFITIVLCVTFLELLSDVEVAGVDFSCFTVYSSSVGTIAALKEHRSKDSKEGRNE